MRSRTLSYSNGIEFLARFRYRWPAADTPVLVVSGLGREIDPNVATRLYVRGILSKPVPSGRLVREARRITGR